mgnify:CR=1 FL=1
MPNEEASKPQPPFPTKLSQTGLFAEAKTHQYAGGVYPYTPTVEAWADHATAERAIAFPDLGKATLFVQQQPVPDTVWMKSRVFIPKNGVLTKTLFMEMERGNPTSKRKLETQLMHFDGREWRGYTYRWNNAQTDADLVPAAGADVELQIKDAQAPGGTRKQTWHFASRTECRTCHNPWAGEVLSFTLPQLQKKTGGTADDSWGKLLALGLVERGKETVKADEPAAKVLVEPHKPTNDLEARAKSYLHANCAHCHQFGGGGSVDIDLKYEVALDGMKALEVKPVQGSFDIPDCRIIAPSDPYRSALYYRMSKQGRGRMPHLGSELVDSAGVELIREWIRQLPIRKDDRALVEKCCKPADKISTKERTEAIDGLLTTAAGALMLLEAWDSKKLPEPVKPMVLASAAKKEAPIRDLFERFVPDEQRIKRLGTLIRPESLLNLPGDIAKGKELFFQKNLMQCATCHKIAGQGGEVGPDLSLIGKKLTKRQLLESLLEPSKDIDAKFAMYTAEVADGRKISGLLQVRTETEIVIRDVQAKDIRLKKADILHLEPSKKSLMPEQLLRDLTARYFPAAAGPVTFTGTNVAGATYSSPIGTSTVLSAFNGAGYGFGTTIAATATVTPSSTTTVTGTVAFKEGATTLASTTTISASTTGMTTASRREAASSDSYCPPHSSR